MDFADLEMTFSAVLVFSAAVAALVVDRKRRSRPLARPHGAGTFETATLHPGMKMLDVTPIAYTPVRKQAAEHPAAPLAFTATMSMPPSQPRVALETVAVEIARPALVAAPSDALPPVTIDTALWDRLVHSQPPAALPDSSSTIQANQRMIRESLPVPVPLLPPVGMIQRPALDALLENAEPFSGLVVSIGINDSDSGIWHRPGLMPSVGSYIATLLVEKDFSCRTGYDEFVMICPGAHGARLQRRLNRIAEQLWDFQLRGAVACAILFSWGAVESRNQPLAEAIASATERMRETKRSGHAAESALAHSHAV